MYNKLKMSNSSAGLQLFPASPLPRTLSTVSTAELTDRFCFLSQKTGRLEVLKWLPQVQGELQGSEASWSLDSSREAGTEIYGQVAGAQPRHDGDAHPAQLAGHHAGWQRPGEQPPPAAKAQFLPWSVFIFYLFSQREDLKLDVLEKYILSKMSPSLPERTYIITLTIKSGAGLADRK